MHQSILNTKKLFKIEGLKDGQVNVTATNYLLSLPENKQIEVLKKNLVQFVIIILPRMDEGMIGKSVQKRNDPGKSNKLRPGADNCHNLH